MEEACSGVVYCQLMNSVHSGMVSMHKVNFDAKNGEMKMYCYCQTQQTRCIEEKRGEGNGVMRRPMEMEWIDYIPLGVEMGL